MDSASPRIVVPSNKHRDWLSEDELRLLTPATLLERVTRLQATIAASAQEAERLRRPVDSIIAGLRTAGVFYHFVPKKYGGLEFGVGTFIDVILTIAEGCASTAWVTGFSMHYNFLLAQFPRQAQDEIFREFPYVSAPGSSAPPGKARRVQGGYRVTGHWKYASGVMHADWIFVAATLAADSGAGESLIFIVPAHEAKILDTWYVDGLSGTGSNDVILDDLFVPEHRAVNFDEVREGRALDPKLHENSLYRFSIDVLLSISHASPAVGAARASVKHYRKWITGRGVAGADGKIVVKSSLQMRLAEAHLASRTAELLLRSAAQRAEDAAVSDRVLTLQERVHVRSEIAYAVHLSHQAVQTISSGAGSSAHSLSNPLQRAFRDVNVISSHAVYDIDVMRELLGKTLIEEAPNAVS